MNDCEQIARRQLADYDARRPGRIFSEPEFSLTLAEAYRVQELVAGFRESRGELLAGYKVGCVSEAVQRQLGIREPVFGRLFANETHRSGASLDLRRFENLAIEGEFAIRIAADGSAGAAFAVIELHNHVFRGPGVGRAAELVANNAMHAGLVMPSVEPPAGDPQALLTETISVLRNGTALGAATGRDVPGGPLGSLRWLASRLEKSGKALREGQIVLTGSPLPLYAVEAGDHVEIRCAALPAVEMDVMVNSSQ